MKYKNIAISGDIGTGKSTLAKNLAKSLDWQYLSAGEFIRQWFKEHNLDFNNVNQIPEEIDRKVDFGYQQKMKDDEGLVFESRLVGWLARDIPTVLKVLVTADLEEAIRRASLRDGHSPEEERKVYQERTEALKEKFSRLYNVENFLDEQYFDLVIDTTTKTPEQVLQAVVESLNKQ